MKSSRSSMRCMVILLVRLSTSRNVNLLNQSPLCVHLGLGDVDDLADLLQVVLGVGLDLLLASGGRGSGRGRWGRRPGRCSCR